MSSLHMLVPFAHQIRSKDWNPVKAIPKIRRKLQALARTQGITEEDVILWACHGWAPQIGRPRENCPRLDEYVWSWPDIDPEDRVHLESCHFCQELVLTCFPLVHPAEEDGLGHLEEELREIISHQERAGRKCEHTAEPVAFKGALHYPLPFMRGEDAHLEHCEYCQLMLQYFEAQRVGPAWFFGTNMDDWRFYPVYADSDRGIIEGIIGKYLERSYWIKKRFLLNLILDAPLFNRLRQESDFKRRLRMLVRKFTRLYGEINWCLRFHFKEGPFAKMHPWGMWTKTDSMMKLLTADSLNLEESLFKQALCCEINPSDAASLLPEYERNPYFSYPPSGPRFLFGMNIRKIEAFLYFAAKAREEQLTVTEVIAAAQERDQMIQRRADEEMEKLEQEALQG